MDHRAWFPVSAPDLLGELFAALGAAAAQHNAASVSGHALHKTVHAGTMSLFGLVGSFWHIFLIIPQALRGLS
jgi:hypothetical protein